REHGIAIGAGEPGPRNAISDVEGVRVGHATLLEGDDVRTGVTVIVPPEVPLFAGCHRLNGNGELTGLEWVRESGLLTTPVAITNPREGDEARSIIGVVATDAPLLPHQCDRLAQRVGLGIGRMGGTGAISSGDLFLAFASGNRELGTAQGEVPLRMLGEGEIS